MNSYSRELPKESKDIDLRNSKGNSPKPLTMTLNNPISATIDGQLINIHSQIEIENCSVIITNNQGVEIYNNNFYINSSTVFPISLVGNNNGMYAIEIKYNNVILTGEFYSE
jgi:Protein of unknown function (DUF3244).